MLTIDILINVLGHNIFSAVLESNFVVCLKIIFKIYRKVVRTVCLVICIYYSAFWTLWSQPRNGLVIASSSETFIMKNCIVLSFVMI